MFHNEHSVQTAKSDHVWQSSINGEHHGLCAVLASIIRRNRPRRNRPKQPMGKRPWHKTRYSIETGPPFPQAVPLFWMMLFLQNIKKKGSPTIRIGDISRLTGRSQRVMSPNPGEIYVKHSTKCMDDVSCHRCRCCRECSSTITHRVASFDRPMTLHFGLEINNEKKETITE